MTKEKKWEIPKIVVGLCEDCAFYKDCPCGYMCPAAEIIAEAIIDINTRKEDD